MQLSTEEPRLPRSFDVEVEVVVVVGWIESEVEFDAASRVPFLSLLLAASAKLPAKLAPDRP